MDFIFPTLIFPVFIFIFVNLILTLTFRAISEELYCQGSEEKWIEERCGRVHQSWY